ncbi:hypothetical protein [Pararhizobium haloflavum]|uniref:hypothetical protein n=1 Tax=Pararhizobium haloflavum TaxID=2037914 RepID=UPI0012FFD705|nr:hypothetical protein [Pararhizobium haloflavum]
MKDCPNWPKCDCPNGFRLQSCPVLQERISLAKDHSELFTATTRAIVFVVAVVALLLAGVQLAGALGDLDRKIELEARV